MELPEQFSKSFEYRNLGPFRTSAWVTDFAVPANGPEHQFTFYIAARHGGVWKTSNNGITFENVFNKVASIGDVTIAPSDNSIVWVGTGENANARSTHAGEGVFKSTDGGETWQHMGLAETHHIARILIHPENPDVVYVAAIGKLFSSNPERGLFKTTDGGENWSKVLFINDNVGTIELAMDPDAPDTLYAASYDMSRTPWHFEAGGPHSGVHKTTDGGTTWTQLTNGLPVGDIGRIGIAVYPENPDIVYAVIENASLRDPTDEEVADAAEQGREATRQYLGNEVYRSEDAGATWHKTHSNDINVGAKAPYSFNQIFVDPNDDQKIFVNAVRLSNSIDGGKTWHDNSWQDEARIFETAFGDVRTLWIDPQNSNRMLFGSDGGASITYDGGKTNHHFNNIPIGEIYALGVDNDDPYNIYAGLQDHVSWKGPINSWRGAVTLEDWVVVGLGDGGYNQVDSTNRFLYTSLQFCCIHRVDQVNGTRKDIHPRAPEGEPEYKFAWTPPVQVSPHDDNVIFAGAQVLLRSSDRGDSWQPISPDLTHGTPVDQGGKCVYASGIQGYINFCTISSLAESEQAAGLIWAGTDDGRVHVTRDGGASWFDASGALERAGAPGDYWVTRVAASKHDPAVAYVTKSGFRYDRFDPQVYRTSDYGRTWQKIVNGLPDSPVNVIHEDTESPNLLFLGNDQGAFVSLDAGSSWAALRGNMSPVPVKDLTIQARESDLVVGTYGLGIFVTDISLLREVTDKVLKRRLHLFQVEPNVIRRSERANWAQTRLWGDDHFSTPNEPAGLTIAYYLSQSRDGPVYVSITSKASKKVYEFDGPAEAGLNRIHWDTSEIEDLSPGEVTVKVKAGSGSRIVKTVLKPPLAFPVGQVALPVQKN